MSFFAKKPPGARFNALNSQNLCFSRAKNRTLIRAHQIKTGPRTKVHMADECLWRFWEEVYSRAFFVLGRQYRQRPGGDQSPVARAKHFSAGI